MEAARRPEGKLYRVVVLDSSGDQVAAFARGTKLALPWIQVPEGDRVSETITATFKKRWGMEIICLFTSTIAGQPGTGDDIHYQIAEYWGDCSSIDPPPQWRSWSDSTGRGFADQRDCRATQAAISRCRSTAEEALAVPFAKPGWFKELRQWVTSAIEPHGLHLGCAFRQLSASASSALVRLETDGPAVWFKAAGGGNRREFPITVLLAERYPSYVPAMVAGRQDWNGWLAFEAPGTSLSASSEVAAWKTAAATLANLQIASLEDSASLLAAGVRDLRIAALSQSVRPLLAMMRRLMTVQPRVPPPRVQQGELDQLEQRLHASLEGIDALGVPDCLGHQDPNPGNLLVSCNACCFLDWAEAYVGLPFLTFEYLAEHYRQTGANPAFQAQVEEAYYRPWRQRLSSDVLAHARSVVPLLAVMAYAVGCESWTEPELMDEAAAAYYRSLTRRMWHEANPNAEPWRYSSAAHGGGQPC